MFTRRTFLTAAAATLAAAPRISWAQQAARRRVAIMSAGRTIPELMSDGVAHIRSFHEALRVNGYVEGQNLIIERWSGRGRADRDAFVAEVIASQPDVLFAFGSGAVAKQLKAQTSTVPIVTFGIDPLRIGLVDSLARPGGLITGVSTDAGRETEGKRLQILREAVPSTRRIGYLIPEWAWDNETQRILREAAQVSDAELVPIVVPNASLELQYRNAFAQIVDGNVNAIVVGGALENITHTALIAALAFEARIPAIYSNRLFVVEGGYLAYSIDYVEQGRRAGEYVARILGGEYPGDLPIQQPDTFELALNMRTAEALGVVPSLTFMLRVTEVIE